MASISRDPILILIMFVSITIVEFTNGRPEIIYLKDVNSRALSEFLENESMRIISENKEEEL